MNAQQELTQSAQIRASYKALPFQGIWTWLTGKDLPNRKPLWKSSSIESLFWSLTWLLGGITASLYIIENQLNYFYLIISTIFSVSGARYIVATIIHQAVHYSLFKSPAANKWISEILSTILIVQPFDSYKQFHIDEHHQDSFSTVDDKDLAALYKLGFKPKVTVKQMKKICYSHA